MLKIQQNRKKFTIKTLRMTTLLIPVIFIVSCVGGSGNDDNVIPPPPSDPGVFIDTSSIVEGDSGEVSLTFTVSLNKSLDGAITVDWKTSEGSADQSDFRANNGSLTISPGKTAVEGEVRVFGDLDPEFTESFDIILSNLVNNSSEEVVFGRKRGKALILNDDGFYLDTQPLNDTGMLACEQSDSADPDHCDKKSSYARQDAHFGRDNEALNGTLYKDGGGWAGFDFTKLDNNGKKLSIDANKWSCVRDNRTSLIWEIKTTDEGLQDRFNTYSWYFSDNQILTGGDNGTSDEGKCKGGIGCDTQSYINAVNKLGLCGRNSKWRLPTSEELRSINDYRKGYTTRPTLDIEFFTNDPAIVEDTLYSTGVWSMLSYYPKSGNQPLNRATAFTFQHGNSISAQKSTDSENKLDRLYIRLVNGS